MEQLKIGDKVKILWEKTNYMVGLSYKRHGVIVGKIRYFDIVKYEVGNFNEEHMSYTLLFKENELVKIPEITKKLEPKWTYDDLTEYRFKEMIERSKNIARLLDDSKITFHKGLLENMEENVIRKTLPTKVVFDKNKRKTTLLFGDKPYKHKVSGIAHESDTFDTASGFFIQLAKNILKDKWKDKLKMWEYIAKNDFNIVKTMIFNFVLTHLKEELGMSFRQLDKLSEWNFDKPLTFEINGIKHTIEVEHKLDTIKKEQLKILEKEGEIK